MFQLPHPEAVQTQASGFNVKAGSLGTLFFVLLWLGVAVVVALFIIIVSLLRKKRADRIK